MKNGGEMVLIPVVFMQDGCFGKNLQLKQVIKKIREKLLKWGVITQ